MDRQGKQALKDKLQERFEQAKCAIIAEYRGMTVQEMTNLRVNLRKVKADFKVVKNRIAKKALESHKDGKELMAPHLRGPVGVALLYGDPAQAAKVVLDFEKDNPNFKVVTALVDKGMFTPEQLKAISNLPTKEVMLGQIVGLLVSPHRGLVTVLSGVSRNLVQVINAIKEKKS